MSRTMSRTWTYTTDEQSIGHLVFDLPGEKMNVFSAAVMEELESTLERIVEERSCKALIVESGKPGCFAAGADLTEVRSLTDPEATRALVDRGRQVFNKLASLPVPTVALIDGVCLGGGFELALACTYRLATDHPSTKIGLPETQLGILPGWGGTTRLPRLVGLVQGITLITGGQAVPADKALKLGMVDRIVARPFAAQSASNFVAEILTPKGRAAIEAKRQRGWMQWAMESVSPIRNRVYAKAKSQIVEKTQGRYPAPLKALEVIQQSWNAPEASAFRNETQGIAELAGRPETAQLIHLFFANEALKKNPGLSPQELKQHSRKFEQCAVLGAGTMGSGIAWLLAKQGAHVRLKDLNWDGIAKGLQRISSYNDYALKTRKMTRGEHNLFMHRITGTVDNTGLRHAELVIEAIDERRDLKLRVLPEIEAAVGKDCIICTNTSSLQVSDLARCLKRPENFLGLHFFNPVHRMPLVEVVRGNDTSAEALASVVKFMQKCGKTPVVVADCAGFLVNRILIAGMLEAGRLFLEGEDMVRIDKLYDTFGLPMGPLRLADEVGLDIAQKASKSLEEAYGVRFQVPEVFGKMVEKQLLGTKTSKGFYVYKGKEQTPNNGVREFAGSKTGPALSDADVVDRGILLMVNEAARCMQEKVANDPRMVDMASIMGFGFPPFRGGVLRYADTVGIGHVVSRLKSFEDKYGERFRPAPLLVEMEREGRTFHA